MKSFLIIILAMVLWFPIHPAAEAHNLADLLKLVEKQNLIIKIAEIDNKISREEYRIICAFSDPEFEYSKGKAEIPGEPEKPDLWGMGLKWSIQNPVHRYFFLKSQKKSLTQSQIEANITRKEIVKGMKTHFFKLMFHLKARNFLEEKLGSLAEINKIIQAKVSIGESKEIDLLRSAVEIQKCKTDLFRSSKAIEAEKNGLNEYLNYSLPQDFKINGDFSFKPMLAIEQGIKERVEKSPLILLKINHLEKERANVGAERSSWIEAIEIFGEREKEMEGKIWRFGIGVSIPIFSRKSAHIRKAKYQREKARIEYVHAQKHFLADILLMISEIRVLEKEIETFRGAILKEGRKSMQLSERLLKEGEIPLLVFLDSQNSFFEINQRYFQAISEWNILKAQLEALLGEEL